MEILPFYTYNYYTICFAQRSNCPSPTYFIRSLANGFYVGRSKVFSLDIKPRAMTGLLFAIVNPESPKRGDFVILELVEGKVS